MKRAGSRVFVTGIGLITPLGVGRDETFRTLAEGASGIRRVSRFDPAPFCSHVAGEVHGFHPQQWITPKALKRMDRYSRFAVCASRMAVDHAGLDVASEDTTRIGCFLGSSYGGVSFGEIQYDNYREGGLRAVDPSLALTVFGGAAPCNVSIQLGLTGPASSNSDACASGAMSIARAAEALSGGAADVMIAGAAEAPLTSLAFGAFDLGGHLSSTCNNQPASASRPFDTAADGFVMAEGAAVLILETEAHLRERNGRPIAELLGFGFAHDPRPDPARLVHPGAMEQAMLRALEDADIGADAIDVIVPHGNGIREFDRAETIALRRLPGLRLNETPVTPLKARYGHALGASSAIDVALLIQGMIEGWLPGSPNLQDPIDHELRFLAGSGYRAPFKCGLVNCLALGGTNTSLVICRVVEC